MTTTTLPGSTQPTSTTPAGADFTQLSDNALALAGQLGIEIIGCAKGFNAWKDGDIISKDCTSAEIEQWLEGFASGKDDAESSGSTPIAGAFTDAEFQLILAGAEYRGWGVEQDDKGIKIIGRKFTANIASPTEFLVFIAGFDAAFRTLDKMFIKAPGASA